MNIVPFGDIPLLGGFSLYVGSTVFLLTVKRSELEGREEVPPYGENSA
jgi:hypothetical protein